MAGINFTQVGSETWVSNPATLRVTQFGIEGWVLGGSVARVSQVGVEVWYQLPQVSAIPGGHKNVKWRRPVRHAAFQAAASRRRKEAVPIIQAVVTPSGGHKAVRWKRAAGWNRAFEEAAARRRHVATRGQETVSTTSTGRHHAIRWKRTPQHRAFAEAAVRRRRAVLPANLLPSVQVGKRPIHRGVILRDFFGIKRPHNKLNIRRNSAIVPHRGETYTWTVM